MDSLTGLHGEMELARVANDIPGERCWGRVPSRPADSLAGLHGEMELAIPGTRCLEGRVPSRPVVLLAGSYGEMELAIPGERCLEGRVPSRPAVLLAGSYGEMALAIPGTRCLEGRVPSRPADSLTGLHGEMELAIPRDRQGAAGLKCELLLTTGLRSYSTRNRIASIRSKLVRVLRMGSPDNDFRGWYSSRNLPHYDAPDAIQFITFRLADSIPFHLTRQWKKELEHLPDSEQSQALRMRLEKYLDAGYGCCLLAHPAMAATLRQSFEFYRDARYQLLAWTIMPNHVHILIKPSYSLPRIVQGWKTYSARWALQNAQRLDLQLPMGGFWMRGYWDRFIRTEAHLTAAMHYIQENPVKAGLCRTAGEWRWSSAWAG